MYNLAYIFLIINFLVFTLAENNYYIISIRRSKKDEEYDEASQKIQNAIDELVNDRMNDIYNIIDENKETFVLENGKQDEKLKELEINKLKLEKRNLKNRTIFRYANKNRPQFHRNNIKRSVDDKEIEIEIESDLVRPICPILNYYAVKAYLSDEIVEKVKQLPNVIGCEKIENSKSSNLDKYYDIESIKEETQWSDVSVQENETNFSNHFSHLSLISQDKFIKNNTTFAYDNNYYYPSSAGKGIDIYIIDIGLSTGSDFGEEEWKEHEDFSTYNDERNVSCDVLISNGEIKNVEDKKYCSIFDDEEARTKYDHFSSYPDHGVMAASLVAGKIYGVAKKANIHMIATEFENDDELVALDYVKQVGIPYKSIITISRNGNCKYNQLIQDKIDELTNKGIIIIVSAGNENSNACKIYKTEDNTKILNLYAGYKNVITVAATENIIYSDISNGYKAASYSNYGSCIDLFAPGEAIFANTNYRYDGYTNMHGTSCAVPVVAGVAATIMSEHPHIQYHYESMREELIERSLKGVISDLGSPDTPNRFINNGKRSIYEPIRCDHPSGKYKCETGCCSTEGKCIEYSDIPDDEDVLDICFIDNGCDSKFGRCLPSSPDTPGLTEVERKKLVINACTNELRPYEFCDIEIVDSSLRGIYSNYEFKETCRFYRSSHCKEFFSSPYDYAPSCVEAQKYREFRIISQDKEYMKSQEIINNFYCAGEYDNGVFNMCSLSKKLYLHQFKDKNEKENEIKKNCAISECHEPFVEYSKHLLDLYGEDPENKNYVESFSEVNERMEFLLSSECNASNSTPPSTSSSEANSTTITNELLSSTTTTTTTTSTTSTTTSTKSTTSKPSNTKKIIIKTVTTKRVVIRTTVKPVKLTSTTTNKTKTQNFSKVKTTSKTTTTTTRTTTTTKKIKTTITKKIQPTPKKCWWCWW